jgi:high-affinity K+ transport system ATPase subunit B
VGVFNASTSPPKECYAVTETNVFELTQPGTFSDPLIVYGAGGIIVPFVGIKLIDLVVGAAGLA